MFYINTMFTLLVMRYFMVGAGKNNPERADKVYLFIASGILAAITGLRGKYVGTDTLGYMNNFLRMDSYSWKYALSDRSGRFEWGYKLLTKLIGVITDNENVFLFIVAAIFAICLGIYINKNSKNRFLSILLYYTVSGFSFQLSGVRQSLAMGICLLSFEYIKQRKLFKFLVLAFIASLFHKSALALIPMYFVAYLKINLINFVLLSIAGIFACIYSTPLTHLVNTILGYEKQMIGFESGAIFVVIMYVITIMASYIYTNWLEKQDKHNTFFFNMTFVSLIIYILRYFIQIAERISYYYQFSFIILLPNLVESIEDDKTRHFIKTAVVILACALYGYRCIRGSNSTHHYYFFWQ